MEVEFQNTKDDYRNYFKSHFRNELRSKIILLTVIPIVIGISLGGTPLVWWKCLVGVLGSALVLFSLYYFIPYIIAFSKLKKLLSTSDSYFEKKKIFTSDEGLIIQSSIGQTLWRWETIFSFYSEREYIYFMLPDNKFILVSKRNFTSENEVLNFLGIVQNGIVKVRGNLQHQQPRKKTRYWWALLCLIPITGVFVGFVLLLLGIFYYKDKWLSIAGGAGIVFAILILYQFQYGGREGFAQIAQWDLNRLVREIEFYRTEKGVYPDSLGQLRLNNQSVSIDDPLQTSWYENRSEKYNYKRIGGHYYLFSSGIDGKPKTSDDIFPTISTSDSSKIGWIRWR